MNQTSTAKKPNNALAEVFSLAEAKQGDGLSNVSTKDVMIPRIKLLQKMSPETDNESLPTAKAGQIFNSASQNVYDGPTGIRVVPCEYIRTYVEWAPEGTGNKAPVNIHPATSNVMSLAKKSPTDNRFYLDNGNYVEETANHIVLILDDNNNVESRGILTMKSSQLKKSRQWNYMMMTATMEGGGKTITPPSYAIVYRLSTLQEETNGKKYYGWTVAKEGFVPTKEIFTTGESFALAFRQGDVLAAPEGDEPKKLEASSGKEHF
jgi:hypothetical protein|tara:strand:- start:890 stop:1681 length:792 start_codon:yes stop_codon:yes gene_type:complete